jgi:hypothetical protein
VDYLQERFECWAREEEGISLTILTRHPLSERATYLNLMVDGMWRGFKGFHELAQRGDVRVIQ